MTGIGPPATCPSGACAAGNLLIGIVRPDGTVGALSPPLEIDDDFVRDATVPSLRPPESRFRFAGTCVQSACRHWDQDRCGLGDTVAASAPLDAHRLQRCAVRPQCQWFRQSGPAACRVCPKIVRGGHSATGAS